MAKKMNTTTHVLRTYYGVTVVLKLNEDTGEFSERGWPRPKTVPKGVDMVGDILSWRESVRRYYSERRGVEMVAPGHEEPPKWE